MQWGAIVWKALQLINYLTYARYYTLEAILKEMSVASLIYKNIRYHKKLMRRERLIGDIFFATITQVYIEYKPWYIFCECAWRSTDANWKIERFRKFWEETERFQQIFDNFISIQYPRFKRIDTYL